MLGVTACVIGLGLVTPVALRQLSDREPAVREPGPQPASEDRAVRVEHEFITVAEASSEAAPPAGAAVRAVQPVRRERVEPRTLAQKTRRALLGDGRYRPEPFPRAR